AGRNDNDWPVAEVTGGRSKERVLESWSGRRQEGQRAVQVIPGSAAGHAAQSEAGEVSSADGILGAACSELPYPPRPAGQHEQNAVDVDDLDQLGGAELVEQFRDVDNRTAGVGDTPGPQRTGAHHVLKPQLFPLEPLRSACP